MKGRHIILPLNRPQYVSVPEAMISALAWRLFTIDFAEDKNASNGVASKPLALLYQNSQKPSKTLHKVSTRPEKAKVAKLGELLHQAGLETSADFELLGNAVANSIAGIRSEKGGGQPASPLSPGLALMQNMRGLQGTKNPPDLGKIIESLFALGDNQNDPSPSAAGLWLQAAERRLSNDPLVRAIDQSLEMAVFGQERIAKSDPGAQQAEEWRGLFPGTPFTWFCKTWKTLTKDEWVDALPARIWVDWATTVLRLGLGLGYLWEAAWYENIARQVLSRSIRSWQELIDGVSEPLPWRSNQASVSVRDVAPIILWRLHRGDQIRALLDDWISDHEAEDWELATVLTRMGEDNSLRSSLTEALGSRKQSRANVWEAVKYALMTRDSSGPFADYYGVLKSRGRYLLVDPGTEWTAVVASLSCPGPGEYCNVGTVLRNLSILGLRPELGDLIDLLERAGMARGSADADHAVLVQSAF